MEFNILTSLNFDITIPLDMELQCKDKNVFSLKSVIPW